MHLNGTPAQNKNREGFGASGSERSRLGQWVITHIFASSTCKLETTHGLLAIQTGTSYVDQIRHKAVRKWPTINLSLRRKTHSQIATSDSGTSSQMHPTPQSPYPRGHRQLEETLRLPPHRRGVTGLKPDVRRVKMVLWRMSPLSVSLLRPFRLGVVVPGRRAATPSGASQISQQRV